VSVAHCGRRHRAEVSPAGGVRCGRRRGCCVGLWSRGWSGWFVGLWVGLQDLCPFRCQRGDVPGGGGGAGEHDCSVDRVGARPGDLGQQHGRDRVDRCTGDQALVVDPHEQLRGDGEHVQVGAADGPGTGRRGVRRGDRHRPAAAGSSSVTPGRLMSWSVNSSSTTDAPSTVGWETHPVGGRRGPGLLQDHPRGARVTA